MRSLGQVAMLLLALGMLTGSPGCGGTETGNPGQGGGNSMGSSTPVTITDLGQTVLQLCSALSKCYASVDQTQCSDAAFASSALVSSFGLDSSTYPTLRDVDTAESNGTLKPNTTAYTTCLSDLTALTCAQISADGAYSASAPTDYSHVGAMIPTADTSCHGLYK